MTAFENLKVFSNYKLVYDSTNYALFFRETQLDSCEDMHQYSCVRFANDYVYSLPWFYFEYLSDKASYSIVNGVVHAEQKLTEIPTVWPIILEWAYMISLLLNLVLLLKSVRAVDKVS